MRASKGGTVMGLMHDFAFSGDSADEQDAIDILKGDHRAVAKLLEEFEKSGVRKTSIAKQICAALTTHAQIEEEIFYPAARAALKKDDEDLLDEADVEHATLKGLVGRIESMGSADDHYEAFVKVLGEYVKHHVREEETELFPRLRHSNMDMKALGAALALRKQELERHPGRVSKSQRDR
jgi:hemerythrin superfamily protein